MYSISFMLSSQIRALNHCPSFISLLPSFPSPSFSSDQVYLDVVEHVNLLVNSNGQLIHSEVNGALKMRAYLSGMPECKLGLNDKVILQAQGRPTKGKYIDLDDIKFHQCVRLARIKNDPTISFITPDGSFDLMTYRLSTQSPRSCKFFNLRDEETNMRSIHVIRRSSNNLGDLEAPLEDRFNSEKEFERKFAPYLEMSKVKP